MKYDVAVIGGGPGGYVAAIRAAQLGANVLLVEKDSLGGVCLNRGCIPTKTLLKSAEKWRELQSLEEFGLTANEISFDYRLVTERMRRVVGQMKKGIEQLVKSNGITYMDGTAKLLADNKFKVCTGGEEETFTAGKIILATGSAPLGLPVAGHEVEGVITSDQLLTMTQIPKSMIVVGAGAVGIEFSAIFQTFGCQVTVVEMQPGILPGMDGEIGKRLAPVLRKQGIKMLTKASVTGIRGNGSGLMVEVATAAGVEQLEAEYVLVSIGRVPIVNGLGLDEAGVAYSQKGIQVTNRMETSVPGIYAIGDVTGRFMWAHAASAAGVVAAENARGGNQIIDYTAVPGCVYTTPEVAAVGLTEEEAASHGYSIKVSKFNLAANGKAVSMGETAGMIKIIADKENGQILGMHILGAHASDLIMEGALAIRNKLSAQEIGHTIHPHPSLSETVMECAHGIYGDIIHQVKGRSH
ncbi:MAG: dihydrolipoamide dehydrogenase [Firmicutes bacterium]|nr:dihydrolipoamide dehydrogenase [Bacillota bacterium]